MEVDGRPTAKGEDRVRLDENLRLAEELGATIAVTSGPDFADAVLHYGREHNVTKIVVGKPRLNRWREWLRGTYVSDLVRASGDIDVYVISGDDGPLTRSKQIEAGPAKSRVPYAYAVGIVAVCTLVAFLFTPYLAAANLVMIYLTGVIVAGLTLGRGSTVVASVLGVALFDLLFIPPYGTFVVEDAQYLFTFAAVLFSGVVVSELTSRVRSQTEASRSRERRTAALLELSRELAIVSTREGVAQVTRRIIRTALEVDVWILVPSGEGLVSADPMQESQPPANDAGVVEWVFAHRQPAGHGTDTLPGGAGTYLPLLVTGGIAGVLGARPQHSAAPLDTTQMQLLAAFAGQVAGSARAVFARRTSGARAPANGNRTPAQLVAQHRIARSAHAAGDDYRRGRSAGGESRKVGRRRTARIGGFDSRRSRAA
ncbi:MAG: DUF4118 domain-containing protein [Pirellulales bacterium]